MSISDFGVNWFTRGVSRPRRRSRREKIADDEESTVRRALMSCGMLIVIWSAAASGSQPYARALGVECDFCHTAAGWTDSSKAPFITAQRMADMVAALNGAQLAGTSGVECWTCHAGARRPSRLPQAVLAERQANWPSDLAASDRVKLAMNVYSISLGVTCDHCHVSGDWKAADKRPFTMVKTMAAMFAEFPKYMPPGAQTQCWMCHKGSTKPQRQS